MVATWRDTFKKLTDTAVHRFQLLRGVVVAIGMPLMILPSRLNKFHLETWTNLVASEFVIFTIGLIMWVSSLYILGSHRIHSRAVRIILCFFCCITLSIFFYELSPFEDFPGSELRKRTFLMRAALMSSRGFFMACFILPAIFYFESLDKKERVIRQLEQLKGENMAIQLNSLRQQINPHFLFNTLNVLKSGANEAWVKNYVIQLSNIYRYVLKHNPDQNVTDVRAELEFIEAYSYILKERFEEGFHISIDVDQMVIHKHIPILSLQMLVENAVKHNVISLARPLLINISSVEGHLEVSNNLQRRKNGWKISPDNTGIGLRNLNDRYLLISKKGISVKEESGRFTVKIPLITQ